MKLRVRSAVAMAGGGASSSTPPLVLRLPSPSPIQYFSVGAGALSPPRRRNREEGGGERGVDFEVAVGGVRAQKSHQRNNLPRAAPPPRCSIYLSDPIRGSTEEGARLLR